MDASRALLASADPLARILDLAEDAIISIDVNQEIVLFNQGAEKIFGYAREEILGQNLDVLLPGRLAEAHRRHVNDFAGSSETSRTMGERREIFGQRKGGVGFPAEASISKVKIEDRWLFTVILRDITDRKIADESIRASLREKEVLLKEIHHRVKNNLQVVSSLLGLQARAAQEPTTRRMLQESQNRVQSMALIHESLYGTANFSEIDFPSYIDQLARHLFQSYGVDQRRVQILAAIDDLRLTMDTAIPCGLVINELVTNSLKYAFPSDRRGTVTIEMTRPAEQSIKLVVRDDGIGMPVDMDFTSTRTLGLRLVRTLADQLNAKVVVRNGPGVEVTLNFNAGASR